MRRRKSQSAMEYLMTYGWAILIIAVVLGALFQLGVFNATNFAPRVPAGACQVERLSTQIALAGECQEGLPQYVAQFNGQNTYLSGNNGGYAFPITITMWVYPTSYNMNGDLSELAYFDDYYYQAFLANELVNGCGATGDMNFWNTGYGGACTNVIAPLDQWSFVVFESNAVSTTMYVDSEPYTLGSVNNVVPTSSNTEWTIGGPNHHYFEGSMANVQLYNTTLASGEVNALYLEGIGGAPIDVQNLAGWWPLNGNADDYSGLGNNGQANGGITYTGSYLSGYTTP